MRYTLFLALLLSSALASLVVAPRTAYEGTTITILYSGDTYGQLESCG